MPVVENKKIIGYDIDGYDIVTNAIKDLLNEFPGLYPDMTITFSALEEDSGITFYPISGTGIVTEKKSVTGKVDQLCNYPFVIDYRTAASSSNAKINIKEFLDNIGKWLERQPVTIDGETYKLDKYPALTKGRVIEEIERQSVSYQNDELENNVQDWIIQMSLRYRNIFYRK